MNTHTSSPKPVEIVIASTRLADSRRAVRRTMSTSSPATTAGYRLRYRTSTTDGDGRSRPSRDKYASSPIPLEFRNTPAANRYQAKLACGRFTRTPMTMAAAPDHPTAICQQTERPLESGIRKNTPTARAMAVP
jgi:hypothetical protein